VAYYAYTKDGSGRIRINGRRSQMIKTMVLDVEGMSCGHCVKHVENALKSVSGVESVKVDLDAGTAVVRYEEGVAGLSLFKAAVEEAGYTAAEKR
jgi:copper chaperone